MDSYLRNITQKGIRFKGSYYTNNALAEFRGERVTVSFAATDSSVLVKLPNGQVIHADLVKQNKEN